MGSHRKQSRNRFKQLLPGAAGTALAGMAAAACLAPQAMADPLSAHSAAQPAAVTNAVSHLDVATAQLLTAPRKVTGLKAATAGAAKLHRPAG